MVRSESGFTQVDRDLERRVVSYLAQQHFPHLHAIEVKARQGVVTIRGHVTSFYARQLCIHCCQRVAGVVHLNDQVEVIRRQREEMPSWPTRRPSIVLAG